MRTEEDAGGPEPQAAMCSREDVAASTRESESREKKFDRRRGTSRNVEDITAFAVNVP